MKTLTSLCKNKILSTILFIVFCSQSNAQSFYPTTKVNSVVLENEDSTLHKLIYASIPTIFLNNGKEVEVKEQAIRIVCDMNSSELLNAVSAQCKGVKIICIKIENVEDMKRVIKAFSFAGFENLKYICFLSSINPCYESTDNETCEAEKFSA